MRRINARRRARGFTLIELMVVIGIIGLLVAIALPAFSAAQRQAKAATTRATIAVLDTGMEQFRSDQAMGGAYPPSFQVTAASPHAGVADQYIPVGGASLAAWALAGADLLGSPGFRGIDSLTDPFGGWVSDTHNGRPSSKGGMNGLYYLDSTSNRPYYPRSGPFVDLSKVKFPKRVGNAFKLPTASTPLTSVCFLDSFDQPILYYRASANAASMTASGQRALDGPYAGGGAENAYRTDVAGPAGQYLPTGVYNLLDNAMITGTGDGSTCGSANGFSYGAKGLDFGAGPTQAHFGPTGATTARLGTVTQQRSFTYALLNTNVTATFRPQREDSFILLSPGPDGVFGTADDIGDITVNP